MPYPLPDHVAIRKECPPGACVCERERLQGDAGADARVLMLTQEQEKKLIARIGNIHSYEDLGHVRDLLLAQLGVVLNIAPRSREVRTMRGFTIELKERPGLCKKTRQTVPAAIRKCLENHPDIAFAILDAQGLLGDKEND